MKLNEKELYLSPACEEIELRLEGVIALSTEPDDYVNPFGDEELVF